LPLRPASCVQISWPKKWFRTNNPRAVGEVSAGVVDALVMAAASIRGDTVYTSELKDLERLREVFPQVRLARV